MAEPDDDFAALFEASMGGEQQATRTLKRGERVKGTVVAVTEDTVFVDIGLRTEARIDRSSLLDDKGQLTVKIGDPITATVANPGGRGAPELRVSFGGEKTETGDLVLAMQSGSPVEGVFSKAVKAGLEVDVGGVRAFCPASQVDLSYTADLEQLVGQRHFFKVLEVRDNGRSVVVSRKALLLQERETKARDLLGRLEPGVELDGIVQTIQPYGVFVDIGGVQGLVHVSELTHGRVANPSDVVSVGEKVRVQVVSVDPGSSGDGKDRRISLSMKALQQAPERSAPEAAEVITATVVKVEGFGLIVDTAAGQGLVPTGELALPPGSDPRRAYQPGKTLEVVLQRREPNGRLRFSAKAVDEVEARKAFSEFKTGRGKKDKAEFGSLGDLLRNVDLGAQKAKR